MTRPAFAQALLLTLSFEGGTSNDPRDPGGLTRRGMTQAAYDAWRSKNKLPLQSVNLVTTDELNSIYTTEYWNPIKGDLLPLAVAMCLFDFAVNSGPQTAVRITQTCMGFSEAAADGIMGPHTINEIRNWNQTALINALCNARLEYDKQLKGFTTFGAGWSRRINAVKVRCISTINP